MSVVHDLRRAGLDPQALRRQVRMWVDEDLGASGDLTSRATVPESARLDASYVSRQAGVIAGLPVAAAVTAWAAPGVEWTSVARDGDAVERGDVLARVEGPARTVLAVERITLNVLGLLSGVATHTARWVAALEGTGTRVRDTRKTTPGLRDLEKYAVRAGGGTNHRRGLDDGVLIKDNHAAAAGSVAAAVHALLWMDLPAGTDVQVEVDDLDQLDQALASGVRSILLDNFDLETTREAVRRTRAGFPDVVIEASGGLTLERAREVAECGVDFLAVGALTHTVTNLDIGVEIGLHTRQDVQTSV